MRRWRGSLAIAGAARAPLRAAGASGGDPAVLCAAPAVVPGPSGGRRAGGSGATYTIPFAVRLTGALDRSALEGALCDLVARHESLRTLVPGPAWGAAAGDPCGVGGAAALEVVEVSEAELADALSAAARRGFDLSAEPPLRAQLLCAWRDAAATEHVLLLLLHHIAGDGWSLAPLWRDVARFYEARRRGVAAALAALPVQYADYTLWQRAVLGDEGDGSSALARQLVVLERSSRGSAGSARPAERPAASCGCELSGRCDRGVAAGGAAWRRCWSLRGRARPACSWCCRPGLAALLSRLGAGSDIAIGSPIAGRTDVALDDLVGFFVNTLVLRTDTSGNPSFRELIGAGAGRQSCGLQPPGCSV